MGIEKTAYCYASHPRSVSIETYCYCNAKCVFCSFANTGRTRGRMSRDLFHKIIDEISLWNHPTTIGLSVYGEFFLNPDWLHFMEYVRDKSPTSKLTMVTNGSEINDNKIDEIVKFNNIEEFGFSVYGFYPDTYKRIMGLPFSTVGKVEHAIKRISTERPDIPMSISYTTHHAYMGSDELKLFLEKWGDYAKYPHPMIYNHQHRGFTGTGFFDVPCQTLFINLSILHDGRVNLCCFDSGGEIILGDVNKQTLLEVWHGDEFRTIRDLHVIKMRNTIPLCNSCNYGYNAVDFGLKIV